MATMAASGGARCCHKPNRLLQLILELIANVPSEPTPKQAQYLAFIYYYTKLNKQPPAEIDFRRYFEVSPPTVHSMIVTLHERGFISREPGQARSIRLTIDRDLLPDLE
jgi:repressor LexA